MSNIENIITKSKLDFLTYANAVIKSRAIPAVEDNLKPVHRRILWTFHKLKVTPDKKTVKSARVVGECMGKYHPHGDSSIYEAMIRLGQWWKMRYPLVQIQGNAGTILGDGPAASRYTEVKLSNVGALMLEDINKDCVKMRPNYDESELEPSMLPSKFPNLLCNGNAGIAVGLSSSLLPHNYNEVCDALVYYLDNPECSTFDLMQYIKGPDFPTGGKIVNGEELLAAYETGNGVVRIRSNYEIIKKPNGKTEIKFFDLPYGVELTEGVVSPLKKLVVEDGHEEIEDYTWVAVNGMPQLTITLAKNTDVQSVLNLLFAKTRLQVSIKLNNTLIINKEPKVLSLKSLLYQYVSHRHNIITEIARHDLENANHKLTVVLGLQKCLSDIDLLISLIRNAENRASAKQAIIKAFSLNEIQADAILEVKLARLSKLDITELDEERKDLEQKVVKFRDIVTNAQTRKQIIKQDLLEMKRVCGDERKTSVDIDAENLPIENQDYKWFNICANKKAAEAPTEDTIEYVWARSGQEIVCYSADGTFNGDNNIGAFVINDKKYVVSVTKKGQVKVSFASSYNWNKQSKVMKIKDDDELIYIGLANPTDYILVCTTDRALKIPCDSLSVAGKLTVGVKSGLTDIVSACVVDDSDMLFVVDNELKGKLITAKDFSVDNKGCKGQSISPNTKRIIKLTNRDGIIIKGRGGKTQILDKDKFTIKSKTAMCASVASRIVTDIR